MYMLCCDLIFSQIYKKKMYRVETHFVQKRLFIAWIRKRHDPPNPPTPDLCVSHFFFLKVSLNGVHWKLQKILFLQIEMFLLLKVHIPGMYIYMYIGKMKINITKMGEIIQISLQLMGCVPTVTQVFRRVGFFQNREEFIIFMCLIR